MANKTVLKKDSTKESKPSVNQINKKSVAPDKVADKNKRQHRRSHLALLPMLWGEVQ